MLEGVHGITWIPQGQAAVSSQRKAGCCCRYGDGTVRLTVEQDIIFPFIPNDKVEEMGKEPIFQKYLIEAGNLTRGLVSCTGAQVRVNMRLCRMQDSGTLFILGSRQQQCTDRVYMAFQGGYWWQH